MAAMYFFKPTLARQYYIVYTHIKLYLKAGSLIFQFKIKQIFFFMYTPQHLRLLAFLKSIKI